MSTGNSRPATGNHRGGNQPPAAVAEIDAAALHLARMYGGGDTGPAARRRWAGRIRLWAHRYPAEITDHGRNGRRRRYDLAELERLAARVVGNSTGKDL